MVNCGKRSESRLRVRLPARLITHHGEYTVVLRDLSQRGASIERADLPQQSGDAVLIWGKYEAFGKVKWSGKNRCGMHFYDEIPPKWLIATRDLDDLEHLPEDRELHRQAAQAWVAGRSRI